MAPPWSSSRSHAEQNDAARCSTADDAHRNIAGSSACSRMSTQMRVRMLAQLVGIGVIVPTMLVALFYSVPGVMFALESLQAGEHVADAVQLLLCIAGGWLGIVALWRAYAALSSDQLVFNKTLVWIGFSCGCLVSLLLIGTTNGSLLFRVMFFGWPLLGVAVFTPLLMRRRQGERSAPHA